jgi:hypothetical protein
VSAESREVEGKEYTSDDVEEEAKAAKLSSLLLPVHDEDREGDGVWRREKRKATTTKASTSTFNLKRGRGRGRRDPGSCFREAYDWLAVSTILVLHRRAVLLCPALARRCCSCFEGERGGETAERQSGRCCFVDRV